MKKYVIVLLHMAYWVMYVFIVSGLLLVIDHTKINVVSPAFFGAIIPALLGFYSFYGVLFDRYLAKKKLLKFFLFIVLTSLVASAITEATINSLFKVDRSLATIFFSGLFISFIALVNGILGLVIKGFITSYNDIALKEELNKKNYEMELALVKNQINPHFLFNTINNIDVMITKDATQASTYLNKLSDIMRFMLYETKTEKIPLSKELTYIEKYIDLQKIRTSNINYVNYHIEGDGGNLVIAPMLFIPFIENAFKHTENKKLDNAVNIKLTLSKEMIIFECENKFSESAANDTEQSGLGNELIAKRLQLLYPNKHTFDVNNKNQTYSVKLVVLQA